MINIYVSDTELVSKGASVSELLIHLPEKWKERAIRYKNERDAVNFIQGRILLMHGLNELGFKNSFHDIAYHASGKPFLEGIHFNISHTADRVVCAITNKGEIGIDIEKSRPLDLVNFKAWFTESEWSDINGHAYPLNRFLWYWVRKESIIKAMGVSLSHLMKIELDASRNYFEYRGIRGQLMDLDFGSDYFSALCTEYRVEEQQIVVKEIQP